VTDSSVCRAHKETRLISAICWLLGNEFRRDVKVKIGEPQGMGCLLQVKHLLFLLNRRRAYLIACLLTLKYPASPAFAGCPQAVLAESIGFGQMKSDKGNLVLIVRDKGGWSRMPGDWIQMRRFNEQAGRRKGYVPEVLSARRFFVDYTNPWWQRKSLANNDALIAPDFPGGEKASAQDLRLWARTNGCGLGQYWEFEQHAFNGSGELSRRFAYLLNCATKNALAGDADPSRVQFDAQRLLVSSAGYKYQMNSRNQMLFDRLEAARTDGSLTPYLEEGSFDIRADFRNFFNLHFNAGNVGSKVKASHSGTGSAVAKLSFDLKVLFFNLDMRLNTDVLFFEDAVFLPMIMKIPRDAWKYVHHGSGVLYSWFPVDGTTQLSAWNRMPGRMPIKNRQELRSKAAEVAAAYCLVDGKCRFRAAVGRGPGDRLVSMEVVVDKAMVEAGFFPQYVADARSEVGEFGWTWNNSSSGRRREGLYFELSGLGRGEHGFEIWMRLLDPGLSPELAMTCPARTLVREFTVSN
jgi:hypothetical protein